MPLVDCKLCNMWVHYIGEEVWRLSHELAVRFSQKCNFVAGKAFSSQAVAYAIGQSAPLVAALWGVFYWREWDGAPRASWLLLGLMFAGYFGAVVTIALSRRSKGGKASGGRPRKRKEPR